MDAIVDIVRMQLISNQNQLVKDGKIAWKTLLLLYVFSHHKIVTKHIQNSIVSFTQNLTMYKKMIAFERKPKGIVYMKMDNHNDVFKEMMSRHSLDFGTVRMKSIDEYHAKSSKTIVIAPDIYFELYYGQAQPLVKKDAPKDSDKQTEQPPLEDSEILENSRGRVYSYSKNVKELVEFLQDRYQPTIKKETPDLKVNKVKMPNLSTLTVVRLTEIDKSDVLKGEKQDFIVSKNLRNIFLEQQLHEKLSSHIERFNDRFWYASRGIPRTLGILLHGQPGCGKTSFIKSLCEEQKRTAVIIDFKLIQSVKHLRSIFQGSMELKNGSLFGFDKNKIVYVFEDFDCMSDIFMDRSQKEKLDKKKKMLEEKAMEAMANEYLGKRKSSKRKHKKKSKEEKTDNQDPQPEDEKDSKKAKKDHKRSKRTNQKENSSDSESDNEDSDDSISHMKTMAQYRMAKEEAKEKDFENYRKKWLTEQGKLEITLNDFLELMDGIIEMDGRIIVMTTNCKEKIDKALLRPGRIDLDLELCPPTLPLICEIFFYMYQERNPDELTRLWLQYESRLKGSLISTAKVMNCFMYLNAEIGLQQLWLAESPNDATTITSYPFEKEKDAFDQREESMVEKSKKRAELRRQSVESSSKSDGDPVVTDGDAEDLFMSLSRDKMLMVSCVGPKGQDWAAYDILNTRYTHRKQNKWNTVETAQEVIMSFENFTFGITKFGMQSHEYVPKKWDLFGSYISKTDGEMKWELLAEMDETMTSEAKMSVLDVTPTVYFSKLKIVIHKTYQRNLLQLSTYVNLDLYNLLLEGHLKKK